MPACDATVGRGSGFDAGLDVDLGAGFGARWADAETAESTPVAAIII
jgi:hypothetical protein